MEDHMHSLHVAPKSDSKYHCDEFTYATENIQEFRTHYKNKHGIKNNFLSTRLAAKLNMIEVELIQKTAENNEMKKQLNYIKEMMKKKDLEWNQTKADYPAF